jgi:hypothetical protein
MADISVENLEVDFIKGVSLGLEYEGDSRIYGDIYTHYLILDFICLRFVLTLRIQ